MQEAYSNANPAGLPSLAYTAAPPPKATGSISTNLRNIKADREAEEAARSAAEATRSAADRRENALLALMQAGFATAAGTSRHALTNIGAGGQAGVAAFAGMEKARREDEATRRRDVLQREQLTQQKDIAFAQLAKDPDAVRTYAALGGWKPGDPPEKYQQAALDGYDRAHAAERMRYLNEYVKSGLVTGASQEDIKRANAELLRLSLKEGPPQGFDPSKFKVETVAKP